MPHVSTEEHIDTIDSAFIGLRELTVSAQALQFMPILEPEKQVLRHAPMVRMDLPNYRIWFLPI